MAKIFGSDYEGLNNELIALREEGKKIVMCSGTFDLFHIGHMRLLQAAKKEGDILIVAVKSDRAAALKKDDPPVLSEEIRMETVSHCLYPDFVILADYDPARHVAFDFENKSAFEWLNIFTPVVEKIRPDYFVHEDNDTLVEARVELFNQYETRGIIQPRTKGISTTEIIDIITTRVYRKMNR